MFIRPCYRRIKGKRQPYWALVESYRTERGPRQRTIAWLGKPKQSERIGVKRAAQCKKKSPYSQLQLFDHQDKLQADWVEGSVDGLYNASIRRRNGDAASIDKWASCDTFLPCQDKRE